MSKIIFSHDDGGTKNGMKTDVFTAKRQNGEFTLDKDEMEKIYNEFNKNAKKKYGKNNYSIMVRARNIRQFFTFKEYGGELIAEYADDYYHNRVKDGSKFSKFDGIQLYIKNEA